MKELDPTWLAWLALSALLCACTVSELDLEGRTCPCVAGWTCDEAREICVRDVDAGAVDAGAIDAGAVDAGAVDAGAVDAGAVDAGAVDAGAADGGAVDAGSDPCGGALFCDGFESGDISAWTSTFLNGDPVPTATVVGAPVHSGEYALRVDAASGSTGAALVAEVIPSPNPPDLYFRAFYYTRSETPLGFETHTLFDADSQWLTLALRGSRAGNMHSHNFLPADFAEDFDATVPADAWFCIETHYRFGADGLFEVFYDDVRVHSREMALEASPRALTDVLVGVTNRNPANTDAYELLVDDVVVSLTRIGCGD